MNYFRFKKSLHQLFALAFFICLASVAHAQVTVTGKVLDRKENKPLVGATVQVKNSPGTATTTDENGNFSLKVPSGNVILEISSIGFATQEIKVNNQKTLQVALEMLRCRLGARTEEIPKVGARGRSAHRLPK